MPGRLRRHQTEFVGCGESYHQRRTWYGLRCFRYLVDGTMKADVDGYGRIWII